VRAAVDRVAIREFGMLPRVLKSLAAIRLLLSGTASALRAGFRSARLAPSSCAERARRGASVTVLPLLVASCWRWLSVRRGTVRPERLSPA